MNEDSILGKYFRTSYNNPSFKKELSGTITGTATYIAESKDYKGIIKSPDSRLNLTRNLYNQVLCYGYINPKYKKSILKLLFSANLPKKSIIYIDTKQDKQRAGECLAIKLAERLMGVDKEEPEYVVSYVNLKNQPHQIFYVDGRNKGASAAPIIYKTWNPLRGKVAMPPGPLNVQYTNKEKRCLPPEYEPSEALSMPTIECEQRMVAVKRELEERKDDQIVRRVNYESDKLKEAKLALQAFLNLTKDVNKN